MKKLLIFSLLFASSIAGATSQIENTETSFSDTFKIRLSGYLVTRSDTELSATTAYLVGTTVNLQDDLGMDSENQSARIDAHYRFNDFHKLEFAYYNMSNKSNKVIEEAFDFDDSSFVAGAKIDSRLNLDIYKVDYAYSFYHNEKVELAFAGGLHLTRIETGLSGAATKDGNNVSYTDTRVEILAPLPIIGFRMDYAVTPRFHVNAAFDYFGLSYDKFKGTYTDILVAAEYQVFDHWSAGLGVNITALDLQVKDDKTVQIEQDIAAFLAYISYNY